ncbi:hypothetical protein ACFVYJ_10860 [Pontibacter sp. JAM-7]|uniref:hypothetical protein n=1 Tax=Pontibacter sp. JAM-7 TaxID=3366581 RepID=UPI003AF6CCC2
MLQPAYDLPPCACFADAKKPANDEHLRLLSEIPSQAVYRCQQCQAFLAFHIPTRSWEVIVPGVQRQGAKTLY